MGLLDWAERKIDRSVITLGEFFKTWIQEVWRLVFRVLVFFLSILLGFLHKPSFEKWIDEQRGRMRKHIHPHEQAMLGNEWRAGGGNTSAPSLPWPAAPGSPRTSASVGSADYYSEHSHPLLSVGSPSDPIEVEPPRGKRSGSRGKRTGRGARTGFADLIAPSSVPTHLGTPTSASPVGARAGHREEGRRKKLSRQAAHSVGSEDQGHSFTPDVGGQHWPSTSYGPSGDEVRHRGAEDIFSENPSDVEGSGSDYDRQSTVSDDYDEFYGPKAKITGQVSRPRGQGASKGLSGATRQQKASRSSTKARASSSSPQHLFSMEGIDSATSPLLRSDASPSTSPHPSSPRHLATDWSISIPEQVHVDSYGAKLRQDDSRTSSFGSESLPPPTDTSPLPYNDYALQAVSVPADLVPPLVSETKKHRSSPKRARSMSPGASNRYTVTRSGITGDTNPFLGGTGRKGSSHMPPHSLGVRQRYSTIDINRDRIFTADKLNTGAFEDLRLWMLLQIDTLTSTVRKGVKGLFGLIRNFSLGKLIWGTLNTSIAYLLRPHSLVKAILMMLWNFVFAYLVVIFYLPSRFLAGMKSSSFDKRTTQAIVTSQGYPYESYEVETDDGYILRLERLPRPKSKRVIYFQHGVVDNSFAWFGHVEGESASAVAFRAYDQDYDVFVGTFRGCEGSTKHKRKDFTSSEYWNFTVNEHGMYDLKAFIEKIVAIKKQELGNSFEPRTDLNAGLSSSAHVLKEFASAMSTPKRPSPSASTTNAAAPSATSTTAKSGEKADDGGAAAADADVATSSSPSASSEGNAARASHISSAILPLSLDQVDSSASRPSHASSASHVPSESALPTHKDDHSFDIIIIAHSMGAMASLIYLVWSKIKQRSHHISAAVLLSPAGYHITAPIIVPIMGPFINLALILFPWIHTFKFPSETIRLIVSKILEDINNSFTGRTMISWGVAKVIGGSIEDHPFVNLRNLTYNVFSGTSAGVFHHFWQIWQHKRFEGFDYGHAKNLEVYGSLKPIDFIDNYDKLDLPIYFVMGLNDTLIQPESIIYQYVSYKNVKPDLSFLKAFPRMGHIDFTVGASEKLIEFIMETLRKTCEGERVEDEFEEVSSGDEEEQASVRSLSSPARSS